MRRRHTVLTADLRQIGSIDVLDIDIISRAYGRDFLPYPFMITQPSRFGSYDEYTRYATSVPDRFNHGDLGLFRRWGASYARAEIRVECHVQYIPADTPSVRVLAHRLGELGYLAKQRPDEDIVDVYEVSPYDLGLAVAESVDLVKPGGIPEIVVPEMIPIPTTGGSAEELIVHDVVETPMATEIGAAAVRAFGSVQSHWHPTRSWGLDRGKNLAVWLGLEDDGEYLYTPDFSCAKPMRRPALTERIDQLIAEDVALLREFRNGWGEPD
jgi:hypothetical protein